MSTQLASLDPASLMTTSLEPASLMTTSLEPASLMTTSLELEDLLKKETFLSTFNDPVYLLYKDHQSLYWPPEKLELSTDKESFQTLDENTQQFISSILTFFLISDAQVGDNALLNLYTNAETISEKAFYANQVDREMIHAESYTNMFKAIGCDPKESMLNYPSIIKKRQFMKKYYSNEHKETVRLAFGIVECIFFACSFSGIFLLHKRGKCKGICQGNLYIIKDEQRHWKFSCYFIRKYINDEIEVGQKYLFNMIIRDMLLEAVDIEKEFSEDILKQDIGEMTKIKLKQYVEYMADLFLKECDLQPIFNVDQPFDYMDMLNASVKENFFENLPQNYKGIEPGDSFKFNKNDYF